MVVLPVGPKYLSPRRTSKHPNTGVSEHRIEPCDELRVAITDQEPKVVGTLPHGKHEVRACWVTLCRAFVVVRHCPFTLKTKRFCGDQRCDRDLVVWGSGVGGRGQDHEFTMGSP
jgi:hypothetical protein